ncbi:MAG TPA: F0F1 ATP synthase subunit A [Gemmatimonadaceae bacterium]|nr:F0F1 ATP synthase subunit A [Gemmatimonadaceae bacterium]
MKRLLLFLVVMGAAARPLAAQEHAPAAGHGADSATTAPAAPGPADIIMPHITDSKHLEFPWFYGWNNWAGHVTLPTWPVTIAGRTFDMGPTKHVVYLFLAGLIVTVLLVGTARAHKRHTHAVGRPRGFAAGLEGVMLYLRNEVYMPVIGHGGEKYIPFCLTLFFFIAIANLLGLVPYGSTATGNIAVTLTLALITFVMVEAAGMRALGKGYIGTIVYWPHDMPVAMKLPLTLVMTPVELIGKFTKPFALTIRLFANMIAGHVIILALIGLIFMFGFFVAIPAIAMALFIMFLELLVVFIQAFIFSLLAAVFIGQIRAAHH